MSIKTVCTCVLNKREFKKVPILSFYGTPYYQVTVILGAKKSEIGVVQMFLMLFLDHQSVILLTFLVWCDDDDDGWK